MTRIERIREALRGSLAPELIQRRAEAGWKLVGVEWEREIEEEGEENAGHLDDVPFGLRVAEGRARLEEDPGEMQVLMLILELIVQDSSLPRIAEELNLRGFQTRRGSKWGPVSVFNLLPRLIEVGPRILSTEEWAERRQRLLQVR